MNLQRGTKCMSKLPPVIEVADVAYLGFEYKSFVFWTWVPNHYPKVLCLSSWVSSTPTWKPLFWKTVH
jgi:hypothetical protein